MLSTLPDKDFFSMGEASRFAQVSAHTLRYWESRVTALRPSRLPSGHRRYTRSDIETILSIKDLLERRGLTLDGARRALRRGRRFSALAREGGSPELSGKAMNTLSEVKRDLRSLMEELSR
ncbi:MAG: MerR family transcriptional regulator [Elusimicrobia bacterium]|nr:MerR family transcriptional regulator [Elusimicrobiota bacterium]